MAETAMNFFIIIICIMGVLQAFCGYKLMKAWITINGCAVGMAVGAVIGFVISGGESAVILLSILAGMLAGGWLAYKMYLVGVFFMCAFWGFLGISLLIGVGLQSFGSGIGFGLMAGLAAGILGVMFVKPVIVVCTAIGGGMAAGGVLAAIEPSLGIIVGLVCIIGGFWTQCSSNGNLFGIGGKSSGSEGNTEAAPFGTESAVTAAAPAATVTTPVGIRTDVLDEFERVRKILDIDTKQEKDIVLPCSKEKKAIPFHHVHIFNESELWKAGLPVVVTQAEIVDMNENGEVGLYLGFQNLREKHIAALYIDIICYNVLKEIKAELKEVCFLDLDIKEGETYLTPKPVELPDRSIRRCEIVVRNAVFADEEIWTDETGGSIGPIGVQEKLELGELEHDFTQLIGAHLLEMQQEQERSRLYQYEPMDGGEYWCCACGQMNEAARETCLGCGIGKKDIFMLTDRQYLTKKQEERLEREKAAREEAERLAAEKRAREEALRAQRQEELQQKLEEAQKIALETADKVKEKGTEYLAKSGEALKKVKGSLGSRKTEPQNRYCSSCGAECREGSKFCMKCGYNLLEDSEY